MTIRSISYGGGVQSTALLVLAAQQKIDFPLFLFANVGDDSEHPDTLDYVRNVAAPYAADNGIELVELRKRKRDGSEPTLWSEVMDKGREVIPIRGENGAPMSRTCTVDWKVKVIAKELKARGATTADPAHVGIGISVDEIQRANANKNVEPWEIIEYPLLDLRMFRDDCMRVIREAGLPVPPKSSCFFCPFHRVDTAWVDLRRDRPDLFAKAQQLEDHLSARSMARRGKGLYLTRFAKPLSEVVPDDVDLLPFAEDGDGGCDSGYCWT